MQKLSLTDSGFLMVESPETPCHIGAVQIFKDATSGTGEFGARTKARLKDRLDAAAPFRWRLKKTPLGLDHPVWEEGADPDLDKHVTTIRLAGEGTPDELSALCAKLQAEPLDPSKPLFQYYVIEGLRGGYSAIHSKLHHSFIDGASGTALTLALYDMDPAMQNAVAVAPAMKDEKVTTADVLGAAFGNFLSQPFEHASAGLGALEGAWGLAKKMLAGKAGLPTLPLTAPRTRFNAMVTRERTYAFFSLDHADLKAMRKATDATLNDLVLTICGGALRRYLLAKGELPKTALTAMAPVSLRGKGDGAFATKVTAMFAELGTDEPEALARLARVKASAANGKAGAEALRAASAQHLTLPGLPLAANAFLGAFNWLKAAEYLPPICNVTISNVPNAPFPLYIDGREMVGNYPISIVAHGVGLNITLVSYNGALDFGITACASALPDPQTLVEAMIDETRALKRALLGDARLAHVERMQPFLQETAAINLGTERAKRVTRSKVKAVRPPLANAQAANVLAAE
jgi:WS/DGAT/MGAT family acyltransferase